MTMIRSTTSSRSLATSSPIAWRSRHVETATKPDACNRPTLLWIDDYKLGLELYRTIFERLGFNVLTASNGADALKIAGVSHIDVVVTDYEMPGMNGEAIAIAIKVVNPEIPVVIFSGSTLIPTRVRRVADAFCDKAGSRDQLSSAIRRVLNKKRTRGLQPHPIARASDEGRRTVA